jgi:hypothetical protein
MTRRIILLSDGTGNSSASFWRTNVWRIFCGLDLSLLAVFRGGLCRILDGLPGRLGTLPADDVELLVLKFVGGDEELF